VVVREREVSPVADFSFEIRGQSAPLEIAFTNASANADQLVWDFGDVKSKSNTSSSPNPVHRYEAPGHIRSPWWQKFQNRYFKYYFKRDCGIPEISDFCTGFGKPGSDEMARSIQKDC
jgi:hypothetical protein